MLIIRAIEQRLALMDKSRSITKFPVSETLTASEWIAKLDRGELSQNEATQLSQWLDDDPANSRVLACLLYTSPSPRDRG